MLPYRDIKEIVILIEDNDDCTVLITSLFYNTPDIRIIRSGGSRNITFTPHTGIPYIISISSVESELQRIAHDYNSYTIIKKGEPGFGDTAPRYCSHQWVNVGFHFDKFVCKICDQEKGE